MKSELDFKNNFLVISYSTIFITVIYFLLLKVSPLTFSFFCFSPLVFIALITNLKQSLISFITSITLIVLLINFQETTGDFVNSFFLTNIIFVFGFSYLLLTVLNIGKENLRNFGANLSFYVFITSIIFISLFIIYLSDQMSLLISEIKVDYIKSTNSDNQLLTMQLNKLFDGVVKIFPSINFIFHFLIILTNLFVIRKLLEKTNFVLMTKIQFNSFSIPNWYLIFYFLIFFFNIFFYEQFKHFFLNLIISLSSIFFLSGFYIFKDFIRRINQPLFLKILILFLLFIFLGYVLILSLFFLGLIDKLKRIFIRD